MCNVWSFKLQFFQSSSRRRTKTEVKEETSGQNSDLGLEDLGKIKYKSQAENAKRSTTSQSGNDPKLDRR